MNKIIFRIISLGIGLCLLCLFSYEVPALQNIYRDDNILKKTLGNGLTVVIHETRKVPIAAINIMVKTGSAAEARFSGSGISHLVEHMLFKDNDVKERIKLLGGNINGFTSREYTGYTITIGGEYVVEALKTLKDLVASPSFDALELKKEKEVIVDEIRKNRDNPARFALDLSWRLAFKEHPYKYPTLGHEDLFMRVGKKELTEYYSERYSPHSMTLAVCGDVKKAALLKEIEDIFGSLERNFVPSFPDIKEPLQLSRRYRREYKPVSLSHVVLSYKSASINDEAFYPLDILATALGEGESSILTRKLREEKKLVYYITCRNYTLRDSGLFYVYFTADSSNVDNAITAILEELEEVKNDGISESDLKKSKHIAEAEFAKGLETAEGRAYDISTSEAIANSYDFSQIYINRLLEVTDEDVESAADAYLKKDFLNTVVILPEEEKGAVELPGAAEQFNRKIIKETIPSGIKILVCEDRSMPTCSMSALFLGGVRSENNTNNGITYLVSKLLLDGTSERSEEEIKSSIESNGGSIEAISGNNSFGIMLTLLKDDWKRGIGVISDAIMNSEFTDDKIAKEKQLALAAIKGRNDDIIRSGLLLFKQSFFEEHPYRFDPLGTEENIKNIKRADILKHYKSLCVPGNMVFAVSGDIDADEVVSELKKQFAVFEAVKPKLPDPPAAKIPTKRKVSESTRKEQSLVIVGFPGVKLTDNDRYILEVIDSIMSSMGGRMFDNIRDKLGMAYIIGSSSMPGLEPGYYIFYALTSRQNIESVKEAILKEIKELKEKTVPAEELETAKRRLIVSHISGLQRNEALALKMLLDELYGLGYDNFETYDAKINNVTAGQIKRVAKQYFNLKNSLVVVIYGDSAKEGAGLL